MKYLPDLVGEESSHPEIAAVLFISHKAAEYHLGNIYANCGPQGRQGWGASSSNGGSPPRRFPALATPSP